MYCELIYHQGRAAHGKPCMCHLGAGQNRSRGNEAPSTAGVPCHSPCVAGIVEAGCNQEKEPLVLLTYGLPFRHSDLTYGLPFRRSDEKRG